MLSKPLSICLLAAALAVTVAGDAASRPLQIGLSSPVNTLDPHFYSTTPNNSAAFHIYERLVHRSPAGRIEPGLAPIDLSLGEPRALIPSFLGPTLEEHLVEFGRYPPIRGIPVLRDAIAAWLGRRYPTLAGQVDPETQILPLNGSREGLFSAIFPALARKVTVERPAVLIPNPFYQAYAAAAAASGAEPIFLESDAATQFLPALDIDEAALANEESVGCLARHERVLEQREIGERFRRNH